MYKVIGEYNGKTIEGGEFTSYEKAYGQYMANGMSGVGIASVNWRIESHSNGNIEILLPKKK